MVCIPARAKSSGKRTSQTSRPEQHVMAARHRVRENGGASRQERRVAVQSPQIINVIIY